MYGQAAGSWVCVLRRTTSLEPRWRGGSVRAQRTSCSLTLQRGAHQRRLTVCLVPTIGPRIEQSVRVHATAGVAVTVNPSVDHAEAPDDANGAQQGCVPVACEAFVRYLDARRGKSGQRPLAASSARSSTGWFRLLGLLVLYVCVLSGFEPRATGVAGAS